MLYNLLQNGDCMTLTCKCFIQFYLKAPKTGIRGNITWIPKGLILLFLKVSFHAVLSSFFRSRLARTCDLYTNTLVYTNIKNQSSSEPRHNSWEVCPPPFTLGVSMANLIQRMKLPSRWSLKVALSCAVASLFWRFHAGYLFFGLVLLHWSHHWRFHRRTLSSPFQCEL